MDSDQTTLQKNYLSPISVLRAARTRVTSIHQVRGEAGSVLFYMIQLQQVMQVQVI